MLTIGLFLGGILAAVLGWLAWSRGRPWRVALASAAGLLALLLLASGGYSYWYHHRPQPEPVTEVLFQGVTYQREVRQEPRPLVIHVVTIDLEAPGIGFLVTPGQPVGDRQLPARTTSEFLRDFGCQVAINGSFFAPWYVEGPLSYYPHSGDSVDVFGLAMSRGEIYSARMPGLETLYIARDNRVSISKPIPLLWNALSGGPLILWEGQTQVDPGDLTHPRTAVALDRTRRKLMLFVVDGRQPGYSEGVTITELGEIILGHGGYEALNLDGGGSSTLVAQGADGEPAVLNCPIHGRVPPGRERPVANHLAVFAYPVPR